MTLSEELQWRGFLNQTTYKDITAIDSGRLTFYMGFDASADSQTVGNLAAMMFIKTFLRHGHDGIVLAGGATSLIGDPGGKDQERPMQSEEAIAHNVERAKDQLLKVLHGQEFKLVNNLDWTRGLTVIPFLRDIGKHFSMTPLIQRDYIAKRLGEGGSGISYTEFSYTVLQGMDYLHLYDNFGVTLQLGGADQWGNCLSGVELIRRTRGQEVNVITLNLVINKLTGKKFGKSEEGAVWLDPAKTSPFKFYQFWLNADDHGVEDYLKLYTELNKDVVERIMEDFNKDRARRAAQRVLAHEVTKIVHGVDIAEQQEKIANAIQYQDVTELKPEELARLGEEIPSLAISGPTPLVEVLVNTGLAPSNSEARRLLANKAVYVNGRQTETDTIGPGDFKNGYLFLRKGKAFRDTALLQQK